MKTFAERLTYARKLRGHTQESLASAIGVSRGVTNNLELGRTDTPQMIVINAICNELDIRKEWLMHGTGEMERSSGNKKSLDELRRVCAPLSEAEIQFLIGQVKLMQQHNLLSTQELGPETKALKKQLQRPCDDIIRDAESRVGSQSTSPRRSEPEREK